MCPPGEYIIYECTNSTPNVCAACPAGFFCDGSSKKPVACSAGSWSFPYSSSCVPCKRCESRTQFQALTCSPSSDTVCMPCPSGYNCTDAAYPQLCPLNTYANNSVVKGCQSCPPYHISPPGSSSSLACVCEFEVNPQTNECVTCPNDRLISNLQCIACPPGFQCHDRVAQICPPHTFSDNNTCVSCPLFSTSKPGSAAIDQCVCDVGFSKALDKCVPCGNGTYYDAQTKQCVECEPGYFCAGKQHRAPCPPNSYSYNKSVSCTLCPINSECNPCSDFGSCVCAAGYETNANGSCTRCPPRSYGDATNSTCNTCPAGYFCTGGTHVKECAPGFFSARGASRCSRCSDCKQTVIQKCNTTHNSVCANLTEPLGIITVTQQYELKLAFSMTLNSFLTYALVLASMLPRSQVASVCDTVSKSCVVCFQGNCHHDASNTTSTESQHFALVFDLTCPVDHINENVKGLRNEAFMATVSKNALKTTTVWSDLEFSVTTNLIWHVICPPSLTWDGNFCTKPSQSQNTRVASFMFLCVFGALSTGFLIQRHKASYKSVARQM